MRCRSCVCILGHEEPQKWFNPGVGRSYIPLQQVKVPFWDIYYIFWHFMLTNLFKNAKLRIKKKDDSYFPNFGSVRKGQTSIFFFLGLITQAANNQKYQKLWPNWLQTININWLFNFTHIFCYSGKFGQTVLWPSLSNRATKKKGNCCRLDPSFCLFKIR